MTDPFNPDQPSVPEYEPGQSDPEPSGEPDMIPGGVPEELQTPADRSEPRGF
jgi:hypothetical protein